MFVSTLKYVITCVVMVAASDLFAVVITVPPSLNPGDQYRLTFVSSGIRNAQSSSIDDYNAFVNAQAALSSPLTSLPTTWRAIGSTASINARDNTGTNPSSTGVPIFRLDGISIANNNADLWDGVLGGSLGMVEGLRIDQFGETQVLAATFTGTSISGVALSPLGGAEANLGLNYVTSSDWTSAAPGGSSAERHFYAISGVLTVPQTFVGGTVPEPSSLMIFAIGTFASTLARRNRK